MERQAQHLQERARNTGEQISEALGAAAQRLDSEQRLAGGTGAGPGAKRAPADRAGPGVSGGDEGTRRPPTLHGVIPPGPWPGRWRSASWPPALKTTSSASDSNQHRFVDRDEDEEAGRAERPDAVPGAQSGERSYG